MVIKVATWNVCLGIRNKKDYIIDTLRKENIDICMIQEAEIPKDYPTNLLSSIDYKIESENCSVKARCAALIKNNINYTRRQDLEGEDNCIIVFDLKVENNYRLINVYRTFNPPANRTLKEKFTLQMNQIHLALNENPNLIPIVLGDFNLDDSKHNDIRYRNKSYFDILDPIIDQHQLFQIINFPTWHRLINNIQNSSTLDHIYLKDPNSITSLTSIEPLIGDHLLITFNLQGAKDKPIIRLKRNWKHYSKELLLEKLATVNFDMLADDVQTQWNHFESTLINIIDVIIPYEPFINTQSVKSTNPTRKIKSKVSLRKRLLKNYKSNPNQVTKDRIRNLNVEIKQFYTNQKKYYIQRSILPNNSKSLWKAVKIAKNVNIEKLPKEMHNNTVPINDSDLPNAFAEFFMTKTTNIVNDTITDDNVYNGKRKINVENHDFMLQSDVLKAVNSLKIKNCEGHDRIPQRVLIDGINHLITPLTIIFNNIYKTKVIPEQWLIAKITPIF